MKNEVCERAFELLDRVNLSDLLGASAQQADKRRSGQCCVWM